MHKRIRRRYWVCQSLVSKQLSWKNSSWRAALCLRWHLFCASAEQSDSTCARLSAALPHILHLTSSPWVVRVVNDVHNLVGVNCSKSSIIPAMVWIGTSFLLVRQTKQPCWVSSSSSYLDLSNFPWSSHSGSLVSSILHLPFSVSSWCSP